MPTPQLMGVINCTPDSYYSGSRCETVESAVTRGLQLYQEGANILDVGGESTRPFSDPTPAEEERRRILPVIRELRRQLPDVVISVDTFKTEIARDAIEAGANLLNDVTGFADPEMVALASETQLPVCVMHMRGEPKTMQKAPHYPGGVVDEIFTFLEKRTNALLTSGIQRDNVIIDPGIGFGKTVADNLMIIQNLQKFKELGFRVLLGLSRKTFIQHTLDKTADGCLYGTLAMHTIALLNGVDILRVHDVESARDVVRMVEAYNRNTAAMT